MIKTSICKHPTVFHKVAFSEDQWAAILTVFGLPSSVEAFILQDFKLVAEL